MRRTPLPTELAGGPFRVRDARVAAKRLRAADLDRSVYGVRSAVPAQTLAQRCALFATRLGGGVCFSHATAALLHGAPLPWHIERDTRIHVAVMTGTPSPHAAGLVGHSLTLGPDDVVVAHGLLVTSPARTWRDLASSLTLGDLVAVGDYLIHHRLPLMSIEALAAQVEGMSGQRGARLARAAQPLLNDRSESRPESLLRVILAINGFPSPRVNHVIVDTETGRQVRPDFELVGHRLLLEYQGDYHRTARQWRKDMTRRSRLEAQGWRVMELNADDLRDPQELVSRIRTVIGLLP